MPAIEIPSLLGFKSRVFKLVHNQQVSAVNGGYSQTLERQIPTWYAEYETPPLNGNTYNDAIAFMESLEGSMNSFLGYDPRRMKPFGHPTVGLGGSPWGTPTFTGYSTVNSTLTLTGFAANSKVSPGDLISFFDTKAWWLFRAVSSHTVSGGPIDVTVKPRPQPAIQPGPHTLRYMKPVVEMKMIGNYDEKDSVDSFPAITFKAAQFINRAV